MIPRPRRILLVSMSGPALVLVALAAQAAPADEAACKRDLLVAESSIITSRERLQKAGETLPEQCRTWRQHVDTMRRTSAILTRCLTTPDKARRAADLDASAAEFAGLVRERCRGK